MADSAVARMGYAQRERLAALGYELLVLRTATDAKAAAREVSAAPSRIAQPRTTDNARARLVLIASEPNALRGPRAALLRSVLAALGVRESEVRGEACDGVPTLAFGVDVDGAVRGPTLAELHGARAKRELWPALRRLRRQLWQETRRS